VTNEEVPPLSYLVACIKNCQSLVCPCKTKGSDSKRGVYETQVDGSDHAGRYGADSFSQQLAAVIQKHTIIVRFDSGAGNQDARNLVVRFREPTAIGNITVWGEPTIY